MNEALKKFKKATGEYSMLEAGSLLVGFSGGADSSALLHILKNHTSGIKIYAFHVNHMIRGEEADRDEEFCRNFCNALNVPLFVERLDIPSLSKEEKKGIEECARDHRYSYAARLCRENEIDRIVTAHNADDNLESVLFNLARGCGIGGIGGIAPVRENIIRPLIYCTKDEILQYCNENDVSYVYDSTNSDTEYTRNYIRHNILPAMKHLNPEVSSVVCSTSRSARQDEQSLERVARDGLYAFGDAPDGVKIRMIRNAYEKSGGREGALLSCHYRSIMELLEKGEEGSGISLPARIFARIRKGELEFIEDKREKKERVKGEFPLSLGITSIPQLDTVVEILPQGQKSEICENVYKLSMKAILCFDTMNDIDGLYCRARQESDKYKLHGMTKSVKKLLWEKKLSAEEKMNFPLICDQKGIVFLPGFDKRDSQDYCSGKEYTVSVYYLANK